MGFLDEANRSALFYDLIAFHTFVGVKGSLESSLVARLDSIPHPLILPVNLGLAYESP
jgi:hypothetical protein